LIFNVGFSLGYFVIIFFVNLKFVLIKFKQKGASCSRVSIYYSILTYSGYRICMLKRLYEATILLVRKRYARRRLRAYCYLSRTRYSKFIKLMKLMKTAVRLPMGHLLVALQFTIRLTVRNTPGD